MMTYSSTERRKTLPSAQRRSSYSECGCGSECQSCSEDTASITDLATYTASRRRRLVKSLQNGTDLECKRIQPGTSEANDECIRLRGEWKLTKTAIQNARTKLDEIAQQIEDKRRGFSGVMDKEIGIALGILVVRLRMAHKKKDPNAALKAAKSFEKWRQKFNNQLPIRIARELVGLQARYENAADLLKTELKNEQKITGVMSRLRCANF